ncbi:hypothetical protein Salpa_2028 [Sporomusa sp. KB1]|jgi:hypothetical protein|nr:hypothetical protein Salpa_2028 [Sporomusa sp. KB1]
MMILVWIGTKAAFTITQWDRHMIHEYCEEE